MTPPPSKHSQRPLAHKTQDLFLWFQAVTALYFFNRYEATAIGMCLPCWCAGLRSPPPSMSARWYFAVSVFFLIVGMMIYTTWMFLPPWIERVQEMLAAA